MRIGKPACVFVISINTQHFERDGFLNKFEGLQANINNYGPKSKSAHKDDTGTIVTFLKK